MKKVNYKNYYKLSVMNTLIGHIVWSALSTYVIISKSYIGETNIPVFESIMFITGIAASKYVARNSISYKMSLIIDITIDLLCLVIIFILVLTKGVGIESAVALYILIILTSGITSILISESQRDTEDKLLKTSIDKKFLKIIRGIHRDFKMYGLAAGASISLLLLTYLNIDLKIYALVLLGLNIIQVFYDAFLVRRYLLTK